MENVVKLATNVQVESRGKTDGVNRALKTGDLCGAIVNFGVAGEIHGLYEIGYRKLINIIL